MLTVAQAAHRAGRDPETIRRWIRAGRLRAERRGNRHMIHEDDLAALTEEPRSVGVPEEWRTFPSGRPQPDWVKIIHRARESRQGLVVDAGVALRAAIAGPGPLKGERLVTPPFMWAEARSALHEATWRGEADPAEAEEALGELDRLPIDSRSPRRLGRVAWRIADELGWAKTYDAEYLALAELLGCRVVTVDNRLRRGADRLGLVVLPTEL